MIDYFCNPNVDPVRYADLLGLNIAASVRRGHHIVSDVVVCQEPLLEALDEYAGFTLSRFDPSPRALSLTSETLLGFFECTCHLLMTPRITRSMTGPSARSCSRLSVPSSEDLCVASASHSCCPLGQGWTVQVACFLASTSVEHRKRFHKVRRFLRWDASLSMSVSLWDLYG